MNDPKELHILKTSHQVWDALWNGRKNFELRSTKDRIFNAGELVILKNTTAEDVGSQWIIALILSVWAGGDSIFEGVKRDYCIFSFEVIERCHIRLPYNLD